MSLSRKRSQPSGRSTSSTDTEGSSTSTPPCSAAISTAHTQLTAATDISSPPCWRPRQLVISRNDKAANANAALPFFSLLCLFLFCLCFFLVWFWWLFFGCC